MTAGMTLTTINIGAPDPIALARFYSQLLHWPIATAEPDWAVVRNPSGGVALAFQLEEGFVPPVWPAGPDDQQMQVHLEVRCTDLDAAVAHAKACGARLAEVQPQEHVRVCLDPVGHPFCLWIET